MRVMRDEPAGGRHLLTIGQLARYAGVTTKAVRVYHDRGLLPEPPRDSSGYRRYDAEHAVQLVKIRTLAAAGVPLARIRELLAAGPQVFAAAIEEIDGALLTRARQIQRTREQIAELRAGDGLFVSPRVAEYLAALRDAGISERTVRMERDLWILLQSAAPGLAEAWVTDKLGAIADPSFRTLYREYDAAYDWAPDDPRLAGVAERTRRWYAGRESDVEPGPLPDAAITRLAAATAAVSSPAWARIGELIRRAEKNGAGS
jgi:DNA-binding transcriptional MerR regulator